MTITLQLDESLAQRLRIQADAKHVSIESCAKEALDFALEPSAELHSWNQINSRRYSLIRKRSTTALSESEAAELADLQARVADLLEPADRQLLNQLEEVEKQVGLNGDD